MQMRKVVNLKLLQARSLLHEARLRRSYPGHWVFEVTSGVSGNEYDVTLRKDLSGATCNCPWSALRRGEICAHIMASMRELAVRKQRRISFWADEERAQRQHLRTVPFGRFYITSRMFA